MQGGLNKMLRRYFVLAGCVKKFTGVLDIRISIGEFKILVICFLHWAR